MVIVRSTLQHITNQQTADIVSKPAFTPDSVLDLEKGTPSQCEAIRSVCRASYVAGFIHSQHALYSYTLHAVLLEIHLRWLLHVTPTTYPFIVVVFHGKSNGCLVRWKLHTSFFPSQTLSVLHAANHLLQLFSMKSQMDAWPRSNRQIKWISCQLHTTFSALLDNEAP